jgi:hypothetical protein
MVHLTSQPKIYNLLYWTVLYTSSGTAMRTICPGSCFYEYIYELHVNNKLEFDLLKKTDKLDSVTFTQ